MNKFLRRRKQIFGFLSLFLGFVLTLAPSARALELVISENGSDSNSEISAQVEATTNVEQSNEADVSNKVDTDANTGANEASDNTGGDVSIDTGDVNQQVSVETSVNASLVDEGCCPQDTNATISGNGADSQNSIDLAQKNETNISVNQEANVKNKIDGSANTGENTANDNNGNVSIQTGDINVSGGIENGPINVSDVDGTSGGGDVSAKISGNGAGSRNSILAAFINSTNVETNYEANIFNKVFWDLNTGRNTANGNNGDVSIITGDIFFDFFIKNGPINIGGVDIRCCDIFDPGEPPGDGGPPPDAGGPGEPGEDGGDGGGDGGGGGGGSIASGAATEAGGPGVVGLSDTSSDEARALFFMVGLAMIALGTHLVGREAYDKLHRRRNG